MTRNAQSTDKTHNRLSSINDVLREQLDALAHIEATLAEEREALESRDPEELLSAADAKAQALARLGDLENQRKSMSMDLDSPQFRELRAITARCRSLNQENAALLNAQQQHVTRLLGLLRGNRENQPSAYDASGKTTGSASKQLRLTQA